VASAKPLRGMLCTLFANGGALSLVASSAGEHDDVSAAPARERLSQRAAREDMPNP